MIHALDAKGFQIWTHRRNPVDSRVAVMSALVPGLERFFAVMHGVALLPTGRGGQLLRGADDDRATPAVG